MEPRFDRRPSIGVDLIPSVADVGFAANAKLHRHGECTETWGQCWDNALSEWNAVEERYDQKRGLKAGRRLGCQATVQGDIVIDVPPESQVHKQVVRKAASARHRNGPCDKAVFC